MTENKTPKTISVVGAAIVVEGRVLIGKRPRGGSFGEKWEFPGGKVEQGENHRAALIREIKEELGVSIIPLAELGRQNHRTVDKIIDLRIYLARLTSSHSEVERRQHLELSWVDAGSIRDFDFAAPDIPMLRPVIAALSGRLSKSEETS